jgi:uncharacterized protein
MPFMFRGGGQQRGSKGRGFGGGRGPGAIGSGGPPTNCICPQCRLVVPHKPGVPCFQRNCPQCGSIMTRQFLKSE